MLFGCAILGAWLPAACAGAAEQPGTTEGQAWNAIQQNTCVWVDDQAANCVAPSAALPGGATSEARDANGEGSTETTSSYAGGASDTVDVDAAPGGASPTTLEEDLNRAGAEASESPGDDPLAAGGKAGIPGVSGAAAAGGAAAASAPGGGPAIAPGVFGIAAVYPSAPSGLIWTSEHWSGAVYELSERRDPQDPRGLSGMRGTGSLSVTGDGTLVMGGSQPRLYIYPPTGGTWTNVEVTVYYQRVQDAGTAWAGLVIGARSGEEGHATEPCTAHTYYSRLRQDGAADFEKELMHTPSSTRGQVAAATVWPSSGQLPFDTWIGWKYVIYNLPGQQGIKLEAYRDLTGGAAGGNWELISQAVDAGDWATQSSCEEHAPVNGESTMVFTEGGAVFLRNTDVTEARYRWVSVREISAP